jgi:glycosyltransferase involved in cell wall biosynthesis
LDLSASVVVCARSESVALFRCLESLSGQRPAKGWKLKEILVVLNKCQPENGQGATLKGWQESAKASGVEHNVAWEPQRGIPFARNAGMANALGAWIAFTDEDCVVEGNWLMELTATASRAGAHVVAGGWALVPKSSPSRWVPDGIWGQKSYAPSGASLISGSTLQTAYTRNVLFAKPSGVQPGLSKASATSLLFDETLSEQGGSDVVFFHHLRLNGARIVFEPSAQVTEIFDGPRLGLTWHFHRRIRNVHNRLSRAELTGEPVWDILRGAGGTLVALLRLPVLFLALGLAPHSSRASRAVGKSLLELAKIVGLVTFGLGLRYREYVARWEFLPARKSVLIPREAPISVSSD